MKKLLHFLALFALLLSANPLRAQVTPVPITNPGFESPVVIDEGAFIITPIPGWNQYDPNSILNGNDNATGVLFPDVGGEFFPDGAPQGNNVALVFLANTNTSFEAGLQQTLSTSLQPNTRYTLTVQVGNIASGTSLPGSSDGGDIDYNLDGFPGYRIDLLAGGAIIASDVNSIGLDLLDGDFQEVTLTFDTGPTHPRIGQALGIRLVNLHTPGDDIEPNIEVDFDDVQLTTQSLGTVTPNTSTNISLPIGPIQAFENNGTLTLIATRDNTDGTYTLGLSATDATATSPADYSLPLGADTTFFTFADGVATATGTVTIANDFLPEGPETFTVSLVNPPPGATLLGGSRTVTIIDGDSLGVTNVSLSFDLFDAFETNNSVVITAYRGNTNGTFSLGLSATDGTATSPADYSLPGNAATAFFTFAAGKSTASRTITIVNDLQIEDLEDFEITLINAPAGVTLVNNNATVDIYDSSSDSVALDDAIPGDIAAPGLGANGFTDLLLARAGKTRDLAAMPWGDGTPLPFRSIGTNIFRLAGNPALTGYKLFSSGPLFSPFRNDLVLTKPGFFLILKANNTPGFTPTPAIKLPKGTKLLGVGNYLSTPALFTLRAKHFIGAITNFSAPTATVLPVVDIAQEPFKTDYKGIKPVGIGSFGSDTVNDSILLYSPKLGTKAITPPYDASGETDVFDPFAQPGQKFAAVGQFTDNGGTSSILTKKKNKIFLNDDTDPTYTIPAKNKTAGPR